MELAFSEEITMWLRFILSSFLFVVFIFFLRQEFLGVQSTLRLYVMEAGSEPLILCLHLSK